jgi:TP901 family phage tail tape measure protein
MTKKFERLLIEIGADTANLDKSVLESAQKIDAVGRRLEGMGQKLSLSLTAPLLLLGGLTTKFSVEYEDAMAGVAKTVDATAAELDALSQSFVDLSEEIPASKEALAGIAEEAGQLGILNKNILGFTEVIAGLRETTNLGDEAASSLARLKNIMQGSQDEFDRTGSTVVELGNNLATTEAEIVAMGLRLAGAGKQLGISEAQVLGMAGALSSLGIEAEAGGTAVSKIMAEMAIAVSAGGQRLDDFAGISGLSSAQFVQAWEKDAAGALITFIEGLGSLSDSGENLFGVLEEIDFSNIRVRDSLLRAAGAGDLLREAVDLGTKAWAENSALTEEVNKRYETTGSRLKTALNHLKNIATEFGDVLAPALIATVEAMRPLLDMMRESIALFAALPSGMQAVAIGAAVLTVGLGPLLIVLGKLVQSVAVLTAVGGAARAGSFGSLGLSLASLAARVSPAGLIITGLGALAAVFFTLKGRIDDTRNSLSEFNAEAGSLDSLSGEALIARKGRLDARVASETERRNRFARSAFRAPEGSALEANFKRQFADAIRALGIAKRELAEVEAEMVARQTLPGISGSSSVVPGGGEDTVAKIFEELEARRAQIASLKELLPAFNQNAAKAGALKRAIEALTKEGLDQTNPRVAALSAELNDLTKEMAEAKEKERALQEEQRELNQLLEAGTPKIEGVRASMTLLNEAYADGTISIEQYINAARTLAETLAETGETETERMTAWERTGMRIANRVARAFGDATKGIGDAFARLIEDLSAMFIRFAARLLIFRLLEKFAPGFAGAFGEQSGFVQPRAMGGPVFAGQSYIVGERRPELFIPNSSGRIVPSLAGAGGTTVHMTYAPSYQLIDTAGVQEVFERQKGTLARLLVEAVQDSDAIARGIRGRT